MLKDLFQRALHATSMLVTVVVFVPLWAFIAFMNGVPPRNWIMGTIALCIAGFVWFVIGPARNILRVAIVLFFAATLYGLAMRNTPRIFIALHLATVRANSPPKANCATAQRFGTNADGKSESLIYVYEEPDRFDCFDGPGTHPSLGVELVAITPEIALRMDKFLNRPTPTPTAMPVVLSSPVPTIVAQVVETPEVTRVAVPTPEPPKEQEDEPLIQFHPTPWPTPSPTPTVEATPAPTPDVRVVSTPRQRMVPAQTTISLRVVENSDILHILKNPQSRIPIKAELVRTLVDMDGHEAVQEKSGFQVLVESWRKSVDESLVQIRFAIVGSNNLFNKLPATQDHPIELPVKRKSGVVGKVIRGALGMNDRPEPISYEVVLKKGTVLEFNLTEPWILSRE